MSDPISPSDSTPGNLTRQECDSGVAGIASYPASAPNAARANLAGGTPSRKAVLQLRRAQRVFMRGVDEHRLSAFLARRQFGKTTTFAAIALKKMMKLKNHTVIFGSAKLNLSREIVRAEAGVMQRTIAALQAEAESSQVQVVDAAKDRTPDKLTADDFAEMFEAQRLEFRYYHSRAVYSRTKVVALRPDTVGETGDLMCDEIGRVKNWRDVWEAVEPIVSSNPTFRLTLSTTPPPDDTHFSFEMLVPPLDAVFPVNADGNWYRSEMGVMVLRVDAFDAWASGVPVYDLDKGEPLAPEEHRARAHDKDAWDRNYGVKFITGGTAAISLIHMDTAQRRGVGQCACFVIESDSDFDQGILFLRDHLGDGQLGLGIDVATTEKETSNPTSVTIMERAGAEFIARVTFVWKTRDPNVARERIRRIVEVCNARSRGGRARRLCIDATNERYFAADLAEYLRALIPVELVVSSETMERKGEESISMKAFLGNQFVGALEDNKLTLAPERYIKIDMRLVKRDRGSFVCDIGPEGQHGDTFDSHKLALHALVSSGGPVAYQAVNVPGRGSLGREKGLLI